MVSTFKIATTKDGFRLTLLIVTGILLAILIYNPLLNCQAVAPDDVQYFMNNSLVQNPSWGSAKTFLFEIFEPSTVRGYYQPLTMISLMLDYSSGARPESFGIAHSTNIALHLGNTFFIVLIIWIFSRNLWISIIIGAIFYTHPLSVYTVAWIGERKTLLSSFFALGCLACYLYSIEKNEKRYLVYSVVFYLLGLMSKPTIIMIPFILCLIDYYFEKPITSRSFKEKIPFFSLALLFGIITYISQKNTAFATLPNKQNLLVIPTAICHNTAFYLCKIFCPSKLACIYPFPKDKIFDRQIVFIGFAIIFGYLWSFFFFKNKIRKITTIFCVYFVLLLPTLHLVGFSDNTLAAPKYIYLPSLGLLIGGALLLKNILSLLDSLKYSKLFKIFLLLPAIYIIGLEIKTSRNHIENWTDTVTLHQYMVDIVPDSTMIRNNLAIHLINNGEYESAILHLEHAISIDPNLYKCHSNLGIAYLGAEKYNKAIKHFEYAATIAPNLGTNYKYLGKVYEVTGEVDKALQAYECYAKCEPYLGEPRYDIGRLMLQKKNWDSSFDNLIQAVHISPEQTIVWQSLAELFSSHPSSCLRNEPQGLSLIERAITSPEYRNTQTINTLKATYALTHNSCISN